MLRWVIIVCGRSAFSLSVRTLSYMVEKGENFLTIPAWELGRNDYRVAHASNKIWRMGTSFCQIPILKASFDRLKSGCLVYMMQECWAPDLLLNSSAAIDVWFVGCIYIELINWKPLFPGKDHVHQMRLLTELLGTPTEAGLGFIKNEDAMTYLFQLPRHPRKSFLKTSPHVDPSAIDLVEKILTFDLAKQIRGDGDEVEDENDDKRR
ncbi:mitogen-activated protein kinase 3-like protein [Tanacetum coccineum]